MSGLSNEQRIEYLRHERNMKRAVESNDLGDAAYHLDQMDRIMPREELPPGKMGSSPGAMTEEEFWSDEEDE